MPASRTVRRARDPRPFPFLTLLTLLLLLVAPGGLAAQPGGDFNRPTVTITPTTGTFNDSTVAVTIEWCDDVGLNASSRVIELDGQDVSSSFDYHSVSQGGCADAAESEGTLTLDAGDNDLFALIEDTSQNEGFDEETYTYEDRLAATVDVSPHNGEYLDRAKCAVGCFDAVVTYSTPAYVSWDVPRSATLVYTSGQARPRPVVQLDAIHPASDSNPPDTMSLKLLDSSQAWETFTNGETEFFWDYQQEGDTLRMAVQFDATGMSTGAYEYTAVVTSYWADGTTVESQADIRVLVVNEDSSPYGWGWSVAGLQQLHFESGGIAITEGDGSIAWFEDIGSGDYATPDGDFSTLSYDSFQGLYFRQYPGDVTAVFGTDGLLDYVQDRFGNKTSYGYDAQGRVTSITDPAGKQMTFSYGADDMLAWIEDPGSRRSTVTINASGEVTQIEDPAGDTPLQSVTYDGHHRMTDRSDRANQQWEFAYRFDSSIKYDRAPSVSIDGGSAQHPETWFRSPAHPVLTNPSSTTGETLANAAPFEGPSDAKGWVQDPRDNKSYLRVDRHGAPVWSQDRAGMVTTIERDAHGRPTEVTSHTGDVTTMTYDGPVLETVENSTRGDSILYEYTTNHDLERISGDVNTVRHFWSASGWVDSTRVGGDLAAEYVYNSSTGRRTRTTDAEGHETSFSYQSSGFENLSSVTRDGGRTTSFGYDSHGRRTSVTDPLGNTTTTAYDDINRVSETVGALSDTTSYTYDDLYLTDVTDPIGQTYQFGRNKLGWVETRTDPRGNADTYEFDENGNVTSWTNRNGQTVTYAYDAADRITSRSADNATFAYASNGTWMMASNSESTDTLYLDDIGRVDEAVTRRGGSRHRVRYTYETVGSNTGRVESVEYLVGSTLKREVEYGYTSHGALDDLDFYDGSSWHDTNIGYNADLQATSIALPTGDSIFRSYPSVHEAGKVAYSQSGVQDAIGRYFTYDTIPRLLEWSTEPQGGNNDAVRTFDYDDLGRLTGWSVYDRILDPESCTEDPEYGFICTDESSRTLVQDTDFSYDLAGNRTDLSATVETGNRLTAFDGYTLAYDSAGNLTSKSGNGQNVTFSWNALGQLETVSTSSDTLTFEYDAFGRRVSKTVGSTTVYFIYDGQQVFAELDGSENLDAVYTYYPGIDRPHMMERGGSRYYYGFDVPGNVLGLFDGTGIVNKYVHTPFGQADTTSQGVTNPYQYMSRRYDEESGLYFMRARYYDPDLARFVSEDPIGLMGGINLYAFAGNDPANSRDPLGLCPDGQDPGEHDCYYLDGLTVTVGRKDGSWQAMAEAMFWAATMFYDAGGTAAAIGFRVGGGGGSGMTNVDRAVDAWQRVPPACRAAYSHATGAALLDVVFGGVVKSGVALVRGGSSLLRGAGAAIRSAAGGIEGASARVVSRTARGRWMRGAGFAGIQAATATRIQGGHELATMGSLAGIEDSGWAYIPYVGTAVLGINAATTCF